MCEEHLGPGTGSSQPSSFGVIRFDDDLIIPIVDIRLQASRVVLLARVDVTRANVRQIRNIRVGQMVMLYGEDGSFLERWRLGDAGNAPDVVKKVNAGDVVFLHYEFEITGIGDKR